MIIIPTHLFQSGYELELVADVDIRIVSVPLHKVEKVPEPGLCVGSVDVGRGFEVPQQLLHVVLNQRI